MESVTCEWLGCTRPRTHENVCTYHWFRRRKGIEKVSHSLTPPPEPATPREESIAELSARLRGQPSPPPKSGRGIPGVSLRSNEAPPPTLSPRSVVQVACPRSGCVWTKSVERRNADRAIVGHIGHEHRKGQARSRVGRLTDGREHPVTTRRIDSASVLPPSGG